MSIIKIQVSVPEAVKAVTQFKENRLKAFTQISEDIRSSLEDTINHLLNLEMSLFLGEPTISGMGLKSATTPSRASVLSA